MRIEITPMVRAVAGDPDAPKALSIRRLSIDRKGRPRRRQFLNWSTGKWVVVPDGQPLPKDVVLEMADRTQRPRMSKNEIKRRAAQAIGRAPKEQRVIGQQVGSLPGRNDPCPCGSGKKWKHCCGSSQVMGVPKIAKRSEAQHGG